MALAEDKIDFVSGDYGTRAILRAPWTSSMREALEKHSVQELELNIGKGWRGREVSFLAYFPALKSLTILDQGLEHVDEIHQLHELEVLNLSAYCETKIRFEEFPRLRDCSFEWRKGSESLFDCRTLERLFVNRYPGRWLTPFLRLINLQHLSIYSSPIVSLEGIARLNELRSLKLVLLRRLDSLRGIEGLTKLHVLELANCKRIIEIDPVGNLTNLVIFRADNCGEIASLLPLAQLKKLRTISFVAATKVRDGNFTFMGELPSLESVAFQYRPHYSHRSQDIIAVVPRTVH